jgi:hypothetical protein
MEDRCVVGEAHDGRRKMEDRGVVIYGVYPKHSEGPTTGRY